MSAPIFANGDRVRYSAQFLRNTGQLTGEVPFARGTVVGTLEGPGYVLVRVTWDAPLLDRLTWRVLSTNLEKVAR